MLVNIKLASHELKKVCVSLKKIVPKYLSGANLSNFDPLVYEENTLSELKAKVLK